MYGFWTGLALGAVLGGGLFDFLWRRVTAERRKLEQIQVEEMGRRS